MKTINDQCVAAAREMFESYDAQQLVTAGQRRAVEAALTAYDEDSTDTTATEYITAIENLLPPNRLKALRKTIANLKG